MDLEEWELLSDDGFIEFHEDGGKNNFHRKHNSPVPKSVFNMNYFIYPTSSSPPTPPPKKFIKSPENPQFIKQPENPQNQIVVVPIQLDPSLGKTQEDHPPHPPILGGGKGDSSSMEGDQDQDDQDTIPHVFFIKMKENEFVDMKMDSPKSSNSTNSRIMHQFDSGAFGGDAAMDIIKPSSPKMIKNTTMDSDTQKEEEEEEEAEATWEEEEDNNKNKNKNKNNNNGGLNIWKWSCNGIGAICSFGVAAATICILILGSSNSSSQSNIKHHQQNQKLRFQIYADDRRIKQVVHHATKLNDAISAVRGVPFTRAHITFGGYYDGI